MVRIKLNYKGEIWIADPLPVNFQSLKQAAESFFSLMTTTFRYQDQEGDQITVNSDLQYELLFDLQNTVTLYVTGQQVQQFQSILIPPQKAKLQFQNQNSVQIEGSSMVKQSYILLQQIAKQSLPGLIQQELRKSMASFSNPVKHTGFSCVNCKVAPIIGIRFKCSQCQINLCEVCQQECVHPHPMFKIRKQQKPQVKPQAKFEVKPREKPSFDISEKEQFDLVKQLAEYGFIDVKKNLKALKATNFNISEALDILISNS